MAITRGCGIGRKPLFNLESPSDKEGETIAHKQNTAHVKAVVDYLGCEYVLLQKDEAVYQKWEELAEQGKREGFYPLIISPEHTLTDKLGISQENTKTTDNEPIRNNLLHKASALDGETILSERALERSKFFEDFDIKEISEELKEYSPIPKKSDFFSCKDSDTIIIAKIPTENPRELAAWVPMGGWNDCPAPEEQVAVFKYWYEKYGAVPAAVLGDVWEFKVSRPPLTEEDAITLAKEHAVFCIDIEFVGLQALMLIDSPAWGFWWD